MKIDSALLEWEPGKVAEEARRLEDLGYDGGFTFEGPHDPFFPLLSAAAHTEKLELSTAIAIAFARSPMLLANIGYDLQVHSRGRFILGLGSQIRPHIEKRFSMPWSKPAARMRELVLALRAIWACWQDGAPLDFRGEFYQHTLMTPFFNPGPNPYGLPKIYLAGVGPKMTEVAGEVGDGFFTHPFNTVEFTRDTTVPALKRGLEKSGRSIDDFDMSFQVMIVSGENDEQLEAADRGTRTQIAFYGSTPAYRPVLESRGWGDMQPELNRMSKLGQWDEMAKLVTDEVLEAVAICCRPGDIAKRVRERCGELATRVSLVAPYAGNPGIWADAVRELQQASAR